jgi:hypothetical protein
MIGSCVAERIEESAASMRVSPAFGVNAFRVAAHVQIVRPGFVRDGIRLSRPDNMGLTRVDKFGLRTLPAVGTRDQQHRCVPSVSDGCGSSLVDEIPLAETLDAERLAEGMGPIVCKRPGEDMR